MRLFEILLVLVNLLTFPVLAIPQLHAVRWMGYAALIGLLIAVAQVMVEGPRWQMVPTYALTALFFLVWLLQNATLPGRPGDRPAAGWVAGLGALALVVSAILPIMSPVFRFAPPSGPYAIGTLTYHWVDAAQPEIFTANPNDHRELMVQIWYPAQANPSARRAPYMPDADVRSSAMARLLYLPEFTFRHLKYITTNAIPSAPVAAGETHYPVLIFMEGLTGFRQHNTFQVEELVSHGYIVAAIDQPYAASTVVFPDGHCADLSSDQREALTRLSLSPIAGTPELHGVAPEDEIFPYFAQDAIFALNQLAGLNQADPNGILTGRLDMQRAGIFGLSFGGIVASEACRLEQRLRACLVMEAPMSADVVKAGLQQPGMWITSDAETMRLEGWSEAEVDRHLTTMRAVYERLPEDGYFVQVHGTFHLNFTDTPLLFNTWYRLVHLVGPINVRRAYDIINAYTVAFFDRHLKGTPAPLLDGPAAQYPEVRFEARRP